MAAVCRVGDNHSCGSVDTSGSPNVFINGAAAHRQTDSQSHGGVQQGCSPNVFVNGLGIARVGDYTLGEPPPPVQHSDHAEATGSPNVFANGG
jgi:uncharacterized Zn-binding protein involved in type VI secretion